MRKNKRWKRVIKGKGMKVNLKKTKKAYASKVVPCGVCDERVSHYYFVYKYVRSGFIIALQMPRQSVNYFLVQMSSSARSVWIVTTP